MPRYAGFWLRVIAYVIDGVVVDLAAFALVAVISLLPLDAQGSGNQMLFLVLDGLGGPLGPLLALLYWSGMESCPTQATLGKMAVGIQVTDLEGRRISFARALGRNLAKVLSALILSIGFLMVAFTARKQGLHDLIAGTLVVHKAPVPLPEAPSRILSGPAPEQPTPRTYDNGR